MKKRQAKTALNKAIKTAGSISALARELKISRQAVHQWIDAGKAPCEQAPLIEQATGVPRDELRGEKE